VDLEDFLMPKKPTYEELEQRVNELVQAESEHKRIEKALRESEEKYRGLVEGMDEAIYRMSLPDGKYEYMSPAAKKVLGYSAEEFLENPLIIRKIIHPDFAEYFKEKWADLIEGKVPPSFKYKILDPEGNERWIVQSNTGIFDDSGNIIAIEGLSRDITARKQAEEALRESEAQKRAILDGITTNLAFVNENLEVLWTNKVAVDSINSTLDEVIGHKCYELWADPKTPCDGCPTVKAFKTQKSEQRIIRTPDGRVWDEKGEPVFDENGEIMGVLEIAHDITEKINAEEELRASEERLSRSKKMDAMGLLAGGVAHDLNNILSGIVSYPELLLLDLPEDSPLWKPIKTIQESGTRAADVVADLLTIARGVATGKEALNLNTLITEYMGSAEYEKLDKTHSFVNFETELDLDLLNMSGSPIHIKKTLMNLVINASEAIEDRGTVTISSINRYLDEPLKGYDSIHTGEYAVLSVSDDGFGITPEDLEKIFEPFYTKKVMGRSGTGLGLAVVWNTVQDHNGYINVESNEKGTVFELYFPVTRKEVADEKEKTPLEDYLGHGEKILVVDDEERQREIACGILTKLGYTAEAVSSGEEAIEYMKGNAVDLIVLDMVMPKGINGRETYQQIIKICPGQKAVIASGYAKTKEVDIAQELGAGKYIKKPYTLEKIGVAVKKELGK
jgi:two-component system cell cycle sensor histidine kinase/response regulator CckA